MLYKRIQKENVVGTARCAHTCAVPCSRRAYTGVRAHARFLLFASSIALILDSCLSTDGLKGYNFTAIILRPGKLITDAKPLSALWCIEFCLS